MTKILKEVLCWSTSVGGDCWKQLNFELVFSVPVQGPQIQTNTMFVLVLSLRESKVPTGC